MARWLAPQDKHEVLDPKPAATQLKLGKRVRRFGSWTLSMLLIASIVIGVLIIVFIGQTLHVPEWVRGRIEARLEQNLNGMQIEFGDVSVIVDKGWRPRVQLRDVVLSDPNGVVFLELSDAEASLAMRPLLNGLVQPKQISLTGAYATLRRDTSGAFSLELGETQAPVGQAEDLPQLIERWDQAFETPMLSALTTVELTALTIRYEDASLTRSWTLDDGRILLSRKGDQLNVSSSFAVLGGRDYASSVDLSYSSSIGSSQADIRVSVQDVHAQDIATQSVALEWLDVLRAPISGAFRASVDGAGVLGPISASLQIGEGVLQPNNSARPIPFSGARAYFSFAPDEQLLTFNELSVNSEWVSGVAEGQVFLGGAETGKLEELIGQLTLTNLSLNPQELFGDPLVLKEIATDFRLYLDPFKLDLGQLQITDQDRTILLDGTLVAGPDGWDVAVNGTAEALETSRILALWPERAVPKPRKWVAENLTKGTLSDLNFAFRLHPGQKPDVYLDFGYRDATIRFLKTVPPITGAVGQASLIRNRLVTTASAGQVTPEEGGPVDIAGTSFIIPDVSIKKAAPGIVRLKGKGSVTAVMSLLNRPPLSVLKKTPLPVALADGQVHLAGTLALPLKERAQFEEFEFHATGDITDVQSTVLVPNHVVSSSVLQINLDQDGIIVSGSGDIDDIPVDVSWSQPLGGGKSRASRLQGEIELSQSLIDAFNIGLPPGSVRGAGTGDFTIDLVPGEPLRLNVTSDLAGVELRFPALSWRKRETATGVFEIGGTLGEETTIDHLLLKASGFEVVGSLTNNADGGLKRAKFSSVRLNGWLDVRADLIGRGNRAPDLHILNGTLDMRRSTFGSDEGASGGNIEVALGQLQVTDSLALNNFTGSFKTAGGFQGPFTGRVNGQTSVTGEVLPSGNRSAVRIQSNDAGGVFRSAGVLEQGRGGNFDLTLHPVDVTGNYEGELRVVDTRVNDAPAMAALLNAVSVVGLLDEMAGQGIQFSEVDARFRLTPSRLILYQSSAVGPSIGLSMDGEYDANTGRLNMQGVISPVYLLNGIGSVLTRKGEGVIGFNYTLRGPAASPSVEVNPLSALTPGLFRDIFRKPAPKAPQISDEVFDTTPLPRKPKRKPNVTGRDDR
jgi:uncharacterized protein DUF3971